MICIRKKRRLRHQPCCLLFKPVGIPARQIEEVVITQDEFEALKLHDYDGLDQTKAAIKMNISQPTFARTLNRVYKKIAQSLVDGHVIRVDG